MNTVGIDLGTTNSAIAFHDGERVDIIETRDGKRVMPSVVALTDDDEVLVGQTALDQMQQNPDFTFQSVKRLLGQPYNENEYMGAQVVEGEGGMVALQGRKRVYSPAELSGYILQELLDAAERKVGKIDGAVITVPANFNTIQRTETMRAAEFAGLSAENVSLLDEPVAAAILYGLTKQDENLKTVAVYDFGGGTFDVSVLGIGNGLNDTLGKNGDASLGGDDFDARIAAYAMDEFKQTYSSDLADKPHCVARTMNASEEAKKRLSFRNKTHISAANILTREGGETLSLHVPITAEQMVGLGQDLIDRTIDCTQRALNDAQRSAGEMDEIIMVGGMTRMPAIQEAVGALFGKTPRSKVHPEEAVALGAGVFAAGLDNRIGVAVNRNTVSQTIGFRASGGGNHPVITKGTPYPCEKTVVLTNSVDGQTSLAIGIFEGNNPRSQHNTLVHSVDLEIDPLGAGEASLPTHFSVNEAGILKVTVSDEDDGEQHTIFDGVAEGAAI